MRKLRILQQMRKKMCKMMHKMMRKIICKISLMRKTMRKIISMCKMMRKIASMRKMMRKMEILSSKREHSRSEQQKPFECHLLAQATSFQNWADQVLEKNVNKALFTRERNHSFPYRSVPKSGTLRGCVHTGTLQIALFRSKKWNDKKVIRKVERYAIIPFPSHVNRQNWSEKQSNWIFAPSSYVCVVVA